MDLLKVVLASGALVIVDVHLSKDVIYSFYQISKGIYDPQALPKVVVDQFMITKLLRVGCRGILQLIFWIFVLSSY